MQAQPTYSQWTRRAELRRRLSASEPPGNFRFGGARHGTGSRGHAPAWATKQDCRSGCASLWDWLAQGLDDPGEFLGRVAVSSGVGDEFLRALQDGALVGGAGDSDSSAAAELQEPFVP